MPAPRSAPPPRSLPAITRAAAPGRSPAPTDRREELCSSLFSFQSVQKLADLGELRGRRLLSRECLHDQLRRRATEGTVDEIGQDLSLRTLFAVACLVDVRALRLIADHETLFRHDLQQ